LLAQVLIRQTAYTSPALPTVLYDDTPQVRAAIARKDEAICSLREQLEAVTGQLSAVEAML
jgi:hypothetical protein